ncbi:MAG: hypothetical protein QOG80_413 [Pseudonocardiales bacterium]|nr:hypothetical protein [Pseudonocardiales bacterium]
MRHARVVTWYPLEPADESFLDTAPFVHRYPVDLDVPPERVWESLTSDASMSAWRLPVRTLEWTSPRPFGVGTTRTVELSGGALGIREKYFRWDEGRRMSFYAVECTRTLLRRFAEDYLVEERPGGSRFTWTIALEPTAKAHRLFRVSDPLNALFYRAVPSAAKHYFAHHR